MSSQQSKPKKIEPPCQDVFLRLCSDLYKYILRKIFRKYISPNGTKSKKNKNILNELDEDLSEMKWVYYEDESNVNEEEKMKDIFKNNVFLEQVKDCYKCLKIVIKSLEENKKNLELLNSKFVIGVEKMKYLSELNCKLNQLFQQNNNTTETNINQNTQGNLLMSNNFNILNELKIINSLNDINTTDTKGTINQISSFTNNPISNNGTLVVNKTINENSIINEKNKINENYTNINKSAPVEKNQEKKPSNLSWFGEENDCSKSNSSVKDDSSNEEHKNLLKRKVGREESFNMDKKENNKNCKSSNILKMPNLRNEQNIIFQGKNEIQKGSLGNDQVCHELKSNLEVPNKTNCSFSEENINSINSKSEENELEKEFESALKKQFSSLYLSLNDLGEEQKEKIMEMNKILKGISNIKFNRKNGDITGPYLIGCYKNFNLVELSNVFTPIDLLFKLKNIKINGNDTLFNSEVNFIIKEIFEKKLKLNFRENCKNINKNNEMARISIKCRIQRKSDIFINFNVIFVNINITNYNYREGLIQNLFKSINFYNNQNIKLIALFFRNWRRKFRLYFIIPEILDIIIFCYYNNSSSFPATIENILFDLFNGEIELKNKEFKREDNIQEIGKIVNEWFLSPNHKTLLNNAIMTTQDYIMKKDFVSIFKE